MNREDLNFIEYKSETFCKSKKGKEGSIHKKSPNNFKNLCVYPFQEMMMASKSHPSVISLCLCFVFFFSSIPQCFSQSSFLQNIQTFYPFLVTPPSPTASGSPPSVIPNPPPPPQPGKSSTKAVVGKAIGVTAASTIVLSGLLFFLLVRRSRQKKQRQELAKSHGATPFVPQSETFKPLKGKVKALIVDDNGLDVLYWNNLDGGGNRTSFKKRYYKNLKDDQEEEKYKRVEREPPVQELPLLVGMSSSSQSPMWGEKVKNAPVQPPSPQLSSTFRSVAKENISAPPPAPVIPKGKMAPLPPHPSKAGASASLSKPPLPNKHSSSLGDGASSGNGQPKLKPLHWDKVNPNLEHSMVWDNIQKGSFKFDGDMMEALFGYVATNKKTVRSPVGDTIFILNTRKSQNTAIVPKSLGVTRKEITDALLDGYGLSVDVLEKLVRIAVTDDEESEILAFDGDPERLADAESFLYHLLKVVPSSFSRFNAMLFRSNYALEILHLKESLDSLESACTELRTRGLFLKLLEAVLKAGNRLNAGTTRGNAQAFNLTALRKLSDVKSTNGKTTLLQFIVEEVVRAEGKRCVLSRNSSYGGGTIGNSGEQSSVSVEEREREYICLGLPVIGGLSTEFSNVKKAATVDYDLLLKTSSELAAQMTEIQKIVGDCESDGGFGLEMKLFLEGAELELQVFRKEQTRVMELVKKTTEYYEAGSFHPLQLFIIVKDFLGMIDQVCIDIARKMQRSISASSMAEPSVSPRIFRFPKLPTNFMSGHSECSSDNSSDDDSDSRF